ncbi:MAG: DinB family protein [Firmicutes bacterium]|nr:DinB family protein [Bacillota bacterium]
MLRRLVASIGYRAARAIDGVPEAFAAFSPAPDARTPLALVEHVAELVEWSARLLEGAGEGTRAAAAPRPPGIASWSEATARLAAAVRRLDGAVAGADLGAADVGRIVQGPLADALTHVGQLAYLRRLAGWPMPRQNYFRADMNLDGGMAGGREP